MCKQGFDDALKFLQRNNMISCTKCLTIQKTISLPVTKHVRLKHHDAFDPECEECIHYKEVRLDLEKLLTLKIYVTQSKYLLLFCTPLESTIFQSTRNGAAEF